MCNEFFAENYERATDEQKAKLENITLYSDYLETYVKQIKIIMGDIPENTPDLTLEAAETICSQIEQNERSDYAFVKEFNKIAGACDMTGGSGITHWRYYINEERTESICVVLCNVFYEKELSDGNTFSKNLIDGSTRTWYAQ